ncbi:MAG: hypothetical protein HY327_10435 [Chloroflexi bacterium]|nr:hypothetical protein [Chloroflexota bacterium]
MIAKNYSAILNQLETHDLLRCLNEPELTYLFKHALTQDAAYHSLLKAKRAELHAQVAGAIEAEAREDDAAVLALHYARAGDDAKAFEYAARAGDAARRTFSHDEALAFYAQALEIATRLNHPPVRAIYANRGNVLEVMGQHARAIENYRAMMEEARRIGDETMEADALSHLLTVQGTIGDVPNADAQLERARQLAHQLNNPELIARATWNVGLAVRFSVPARAIEYHQQALQLARAANLQELAGFCLLDLANEMQMAGDWRGAYRHGGEALEIFQALHNPPMLANAFGSRAIILYGRGEARAARTAAEEGARISAEIENPWGIGYNEWTLIGIEIDAAEFARAFERAERAEKSTHALGVPLFAGLTDLWMARLYLELNQPERAAEIAERGGRALKQMHAPIWDTLAAGTLARALIRQQKLGDAHKLLDPLATNLQNADANLWGYSVSAPAIIELALAENRILVAQKFADAFLALFEREETWGYAAELYYLRGLALRARGDLENAERDLNRAHAIATRAEKSILLWRVDAARAEIFAARGDNAQAARTRQNTAEIVRGIAAKITDAEWCETFLAQEEVREVLRGDESR